MTAIRRTVTCAAALLALCGLAAARQAPSDLDAGQRAAVTRFFDLQIAHAASLADRGMPEQALEKVRAIEAIIPDWAGGPDSVKDLKLRLLDAIQSSSLLKGAVLAKQATIEVGDPAAFDVVVTNVSQAEIVIDMGGRRSGGLTLLSVRLEEHDHFGAVRANERNVVFTGFSGAATLKPGESFSAGFTLDTASASPLSPTLRSYAVGGILRPLSVKAGERIVTRPVNLAQCTVAVYPRGSGPTRENPLEALAEGIEEGYGPKVFMAARFLRKESASEGIALLERLLDAPFADPAMARTIRASIREIAGDPSAPLDPDGFNRWRALRAGRQNR